MNRILIAGAGAVSPAGWGVEAMRLALCKKEPIPARSIERPGRTRPLLIRSVPHPATKPSFVSHTRFRRSSSISQFAAAAALEALGTPAPKPDTAQKIGLVVCVMAGCVNYSRRFYAETWRDPATASPVVFPETVFNAPASHIAALLGSTELNYTLVGDSGMFVVGLALAADWLLSCHVDSCIVVGAEELDWLTADAAQLFARGTILSEGAGALLLRRGNPKSGDIELDSVTDAHLFSRRQSRFEAAQSTQRDLPVSDFLCDSCNGHPKSDAPEEAAWRNWCGPRISPKKVLGEGLAASGAWQCIAAIDALRAPELSSAAVTVTGPNQQSIGARFSKLL